MTNIKKNLLLIALVLGLSAFILNSASYAKNIAVVKKAQTTSVLINSTPIHISIPSIGVNTNVESLGLTKDGAMDSPAGPSATGWYSLGTIPGNVGSAVIDGHSGYKNKKPAVFDNLTKIKVGDKIYVKSTNGITNTFIVRKLKDYDPNTDATAIFTSKDGLSHLNLITCTGVWDAKKNSHSKRLVVFADKMK
jgi:sortase A